MERRIDVDAAFASVAAYRCLLERFHGIHDALEVPLEQAAATHLPQLAIDRRTPRLERDLRLLGAAPSRLPGPETIPFLDGAAAVAGAAYVLAGSALGGAVLAQMALVRLGISAGGGAEFLTPAPGLARRWRATQATIEQAAESDGVAAVLAAATDTFEWIDAWMAR